jgi:hypothetical protein
MKKSLLLYLFILALLFNVFTYMYYSKQVVFEQAKYERMHKKLKDSLTAVTNSLSEADYFSLAKNDNAQNYFDSNSSEKTIRFEKIIPFVTEVLLDYNSNPKGNPYVGQDALTANKFVINKVKVLNHRWIIADFNDGEYWGEVLLKYFINADNTVSFEINQSLIYPKQ